MSLLKQAEETLAPDMDEAMAVMTRAKQKQLETEAAIAEEKDQISGVAPKPFESLDDQSEPQTDQELPWEDFDLDLFQGGHERVRLTKSMKRANSLKFLREKAKSRGHPLDLSAKELRQLQEADTTLSAVRRAANGEASTAGSGFHVEDGLIYCRWRP